MAFSENLNFIWKISNFKNILHPTIYVCTIYVFEDKLPVICNMALTYFGNFFKIWDRDQDKRVTGLDADEHETIFCSLNSNFSWRVIL